MTHEHCPRSQASQKKNFMVYRALRIVSKLLLSHRYSPAGSERASRKDRSNPAGEVWRVTGKVCFQSEAEGAALGSAKACLEKSCG